MLRQAGVYLMVIFAGTSAQAQETINLAPLPATNVTHLRTKLLRELEELNEISRRMQALKAYQEALIERLASAKDGSVNGVSFPAYLCRGQMENICAFLPITTGKIVISSAGKQGE